MTSNFRECYIYIMLPNTTQFITAARFQNTTEKNGHIIGRLVYGKNYLSNPDAIEIDPVELKLEQAPYETVKLNGFFGAIRDAMPDYWGRRVIEHHTNDRILDEFDYLMHGPDDRAGALGFGLNVVPPAPSRHFNKTLDLETIQLVADSILNNEPLKLNHPSDEKQIKELLLQGTSMGGARPKTVVEHNKALWLAKFSASTDLWNQPCVEHGLLKLANKCGLKVAHSKVIEVGGRSVILVKRFDREKQDAGYERYRMISALTVLKSEALPMERDHWSYLLFADELRRISSQPIRDCHELFARMCFNAFVSNLDDHPRNHAMIAKNNAWELSPAYDLTPSPSFSQDSRYLAMNCGEWGRVAKIENLLSGHAHFLLTKEEALVIISRLKTIIENEWKLTMKQAGVSEQDCYRIQSAFLYEGLFYPLNRQE